MSRSNPTGNNPNPSTRWFEWKGGDGHLSYYDKDKKESVTVPTPFTFLVLDVLSTVKGYNKKAKSGIFANEVRDTRQEQLEVKFFEGDTIAKGLWQDIKEKVSYAKGKFTASVYVAYKEGDGLKIGNIAFTGCALGPWFDFYRENRQECGKQAVVIKAGEKDTTGDVEFVPPSFSLKEVSEETDEQAKQLDIALQGFLKGYMTRAESVDQTPVQEESLDQTPERDQDGDEIPF